MSLKSNLLIKLRVSETASACGQRSVVHSLPQLVVVWSYCGWREEAVMEKMFDIVVYLVKQLIVGVFQQLNERRQVWRTKSTA